MSSPGFPSFDDFQQEIEKEITRAFTRAEQAAAFSERARSLTGKASSKHGEVEATVDAAGSPIDLRISPETKNWPDGELERVILDLFGQAHRDATSSYVEAVRETFAKDDPETADLMISQASERLANREQPRDDDDQTGGPQRPNSAVWNDRRKRE